jgi:hypothetical protein
MRIVLSLDLFIIPRAKALGIQNKSRDSTILMFPQDTGLFIMVMFEKFLMKVDVTNHNYDAWVERVSVLSDKLKQNFAHWHSLAIDNLIYARPIKYLFYGLFNFLNFVCLMLLLSFSFFFPSKPLHKCLCRNQKETWRTQLRSGIWRGVVKLKTQHGYIITIYVWYHRQFSIALVWGPERWHIESWPSRLTSHDMPSC